MGGRMGHQDNPGGGSVFWIELPYAKEEAEPCSTEPIAADHFAHNPPRKSCRILVVDDVEINRDIAMAFARSGGHEVSCASGGAEAEAAVATGDFDLVLMDVRMPAIDGLEATRRIRASEGPRSRVPILGVTAQAFSEQVAECRKAGMDGHLSKPFTVEKLLEAIEDAVAASDQASVGRREIGKQQGDRSVLTPLEAP